MLRTSLYVYSIEVRGELVYLPMILSVKSLDMADQRTQSFNS